MANKLQTTKLCSFITKSCLYYFSRDFNLTVMKRISSIFLVLSVSLVILAQPDPDLPGKLPGKKQPACDTRVELADSSINYFYSITEELYTPASVILYDYNKNWNLTTVICKSLPDRSNIYRQIFEYDGKQNITRYTYQLWAENDWRNNLINERTYSSDGLIDTEVFIRENVLGVFAPYQRHFYTQCEGRVTGYIRQVLDASGNWYDFSEHVYVYDDLGRLTVLYGKYFNTNLIYWERTSVFGPDGRISERYLKLLRYDPVEKGNILTNSTLQIYHNNMFGNADTIYNYDYNRADQQWVHVSKDVGYFSLIKGKKVSICHKGVSICVSSNAVQKHLEHGDKLGECSAVSEDLENNRIEPDKGRKVEFSLFPNPASGFLTVMIEGEADCEGNCTATIYSADGKIVLSSDVSGQREITFNVSALKNGTYYLLMKSEKGFNASPFVKK